MSINLEATIGQRGQVVIPKPIRDAYDLRPGSTIRFSVEADRIVIRADDDVLADYLDAIEKRPEPTDIDWDERHAARFG